MQDLSISRFGSIDELNEAVASKEGVLTVSMESLRDAYGAGRLGVHVRSAIHYELLNRGLGHFPEDLPQYQEANVRIYKLGSGIAKHIEAVLNPSADSDEELRKAQGGKAEEILGKVRELVCD